MKKLIFLLLFIPLIRFVIEISYSLFKLVWYVIFATIFLLILNFIGIHNAHSDTNLHRLYPPITIKTSVRGHGKVSIKLNFEKNFSTKSQSKFYQGMIRFRNEQLPVSASRVNNNWKFKFFGKKTGSAQKRKLFILKSNDLNQYKVLTLPSNILSNNYCDQSESLQSEKNTVSSSTLTERVRIVELRTFADSEWINKYGSSYNDEILTIVNDAEVLYNSQLRVRFDVLSQDVLSMSDEINASKLLYEFTNNSLTTNREADLKHLFTGKDLSGSVVGIAYIGGVCKRYSYGLTQSYGTLTAKIFAHEIGHNLGASHDIESPGTLMYPYISSDPMRLSDNSIQQIDGFIKNYATCIDEDDLPINLNNAQLKFTRKKRKIFVTVESDTGTKVSGENVVLKINRKIYRLTTNNLGFIRRKIRKNSKIKRYKIEAYLEKNPNKSIKLNIRLR